MLTDFESRLRQSNLSSNTIESYSKAVRQYFSLYDTVTKHNLLSFKGYLIEKYKPKTVNLRLQAINRYLEYLKKDHLKLKFVKVQQQNFLENVISDADYRFFIKKLKVDDRMNWYFVVRYLCATGARISELIQIKIENVEVGYLDIYGKGGKIRCYVYVNSKYPRLFAAMVLGTGYGKTSFEWFDLAYAEQICGVFESAQKEMKK